MQTALAELPIERIQIVTPHGRTYDLSEQIQVTNLIDLMPKPVK